MNIYVEISFIFIVSFFWLSFVILSYTLILLVSQLQT